MTASKKVTIDLSTETKKLLVSYGKMNQSYDDLICEILTHVDTCDKWWSENR